MRRYLVIANETLNSPILHEWVSETLAANEDGCHFHIVVPATRVSRRFTWTAGEARAAASERLDRVILDFQLLGASVDGAIGDESPVLAATDALRGSHHDAVVISTLPADESSWLRLDVVKQLRQRVTVPVIHLSGARQPVGSSSSRFYNGGMVLAVGIVGFIAVVSLVAGRGASSTVLAKPASSAAAPAAAATDAAKLVPDPNAPPPPVMDPTAPPIMSGTVHNLNLTIVEKDMTVAPGIVQHVWTFNGTVPAPTLRVHIGDIVHVHFSNPASNQMAHSLDFHASQTAANGQMRTIPPGGVLDVEWKAEFAGVWMYHCVTGPPAMHVGSGMFGMVIVEPKEGLPKVDKEFVVIQNEWYYGAQHGTINADKVMSSAPAPDVMAFNGIPNQYADHPLKMNPGERGRMFVLNVGPNLESSFHIVGMIFDSVIKEGVALSPDNPEHFGSQAVNLAPAQGAIVEFTAPEDGMYEFVTHTFNFHDRGAHGMIQVGDGKPKPHIFESNGDNAITPVMAEETTTPTTTAP